MAKQIIFYLVLLIRSAGVLAAGDDGTCSEKEKALFLQSVQAAVKSNWNVPYEDRYLVCTVLLKLNWRGEVLHVGIANCGEDPRVHRSVVAAGYTASPVRMPENRACFDRNVIVKLESRALEYAGQDESVDTE